MQSNHNSKKDKPKFIDAKILIAALAVAVTIGFWNLFSNNAFAAEISSPSVVVTLPPQPPSVAADNLPPLPTLVPLVEVTIPQVAQGSEAVNVSQPGNQTPINNNAAGQLASPLRVVGIPTQVIVQKNKPVFGEVISAASSTDNSSGSSSSKSGKSSSKSSSTTKSSKK